MANNAVQLASGKFGKILNYSALDGLTSYTVEVWLNKDPSDATRSAIYMIGTGSGTDYVGYLEEETTHTGVNFGHRYTGTSADGYKDSGVFVDSTWVHLAAVFVQTQKTKVYKNGAEITYTLQQTPSGTYYSTNGVDAYLGAYLAGFSKPCYEGGYGCFRMWNVARTVTEIADNMNYYLDPAYETGLIVNCNFDEGTGTTVDNDVAGSNDCLLTGSPSWTTGPTLTNKSYGGATFPGYYGFGGFT